MRLMIVISLVLCVTGCAVATVTNKDLRRFTADPVEPTLVNVPELGKEVTVEVGESLVGKTYRRVLPILELKSSAEFVIPALKSTGLQAVLQVGRYTKSRRDDAGELYAASAPYRDRQGKIHPVTPAIYVGKSGEKQGCLLPHEGGGALCGPLTNAIMEAGSVEQSFEGSFRRELIYLGMSKNVISVTYREFKDDLARPAFSQEMRYDLDEGRVVGFRGARFEILKASNLGITYRVLRYLD